LWFRGKIAATTTFRKRRFGVPAIEVKWFTHGCMGAFLYCVEGGGACVTRDIEGFFDNDWWGLGDQIVDRLRLVFVHVK
jgi:hypothetical protein